MTQERAPRVDDSVQIGRDITVEAGEIRGYPVARIPQALPVTRRMDQVGPLSTR